jgi:hypothetical protein
VEAAVDARGQLIQAFVGPGLSGRLHS